MSKRDEFIAQAPWLIELIGSALNEYDGAQDIEGEHVAIDKVRYLSSRLKELAIAAIKERDGSEDAGT